jgi:hypothetical protein
MHDFPGCPHPLRALQEDLHQVEGVERPRIDRHRGPVAQPPDAQPADVPIVHRGGHALPAAHDAELVVAEDLGDAGARLVKVTGVEVRHWSATALAG